MHIILYTLISYNISHVYCMPVFIFFSISADRCWKPRHNLVISQRCTQGTFVYRETTSENECIKTFKFWLSAIVAKQVFGVVDTTCYILLHILLHYCCIQLYVILNATGKKKIQKSKLQVGSLFILSNLEIEWFSTICVATL